MDQADFSLSAEDAMKLRLGHALEAAKLLQDWSKWLIGVETGFIVSIGVILSMKVNSGQNDLHFFIGGASKIWAVVALICFVVSISWASLLILALSDAVGRIVETNGNLSSASVPYVRKTISHAKLWQFWFFWTGLVCFLISILLSTISTASS